MRAASQTSGAEGRSSFRSQISDAGSFADLRPAHSDTRSLRDMRVDHRGRDILAAREILDRRPPRNRSCRLVRGDLGNAAQRLKQESGNGLYVGGVTLPLTLTGLGLIDAYDHRASEARAGARGDVVRGALEACRAEARKPAGVPLARWCCGMCQGGTRWMLPPMGANGLAVCRHPV
jgi:hypothetical protein